MSSNSEVIHTGFWNNWSKSGASASTLTLSNRNGAVLIAALAIFIQLAGGQSWNIICFIAYQIKTSKRARDGFHHQQQASLRNNSSDVKTLWQLTEIWWSWRSLSRGSFRNSIALIILAAIHLVAFSAAGILSSHITTVNNQVLVARSSNCGPWERDIDVMQSVVVSPADIAYNAYGMNQIQTGRQYVQSCVMGSESLPECDRFQKPKVAWTSSNVTCPFQDLCLGPPNSSLLMETGLIDSREDLGINSRDEDRVQVRRSATCSPITTDGYTKRGNTTIHYKIFNQVNQTGDMPTNYTAAFYGSSNNNDTLLGIDDPELENMTYIYTNFREVATAYYSFDQPPYDITAQLADLDWGFTPIPALDIKNSSVTIVFASFYGAYSGESDDLWLPAHQPLSLKGAHDGYSEVKIDGIYGPDKPFSVMACTEQFQFCNPSARSGVPQCTDYASMAQLSNYTDNNSTFRNVFTNEHQMALALALGLAVNPANINSVVVSPPALLLASQLSATQFSIPPAPNQWVLETENWFQIGLAIMQRYTVDYISGPPTQFTPHVAYYNESTMPEGLKWLCGTQIVRRNDFTNFSSLSIGLVFGLGALIIILSLCLETIAGYVRLKWRSGYWRQTAWWAEGTLQLQRRACEGMGVRDWDFKEWEQVPVTGKGRLWTTLEADEKFTLTRGRTFDSMAKVDPEQGISVHEISMTESLEQVTSEQTQSSGEQTLREETSLWRSDPAAGERVFEHERESVYSVYSVKDNSEQGASHNYPEHQQHGGERNVAQAGK